MMTHADWEPAGREGSDLAGYTLERCIDTDALGEVYRASRGTRQFSVRIFFPDVVGDDKVANKLVDELAELKGATHPALVRVHDSGRSEDGLLYVVSEWVDGISLRDVLEDKRHLEFSDAAPVVRLILDGLAALHDADLVHGYLTPDNIYIEYGANGRRTVRLLDAGLWRVFLLWEPDTLAGDHPEFYEGHCDYMSPETIEGEDPDVSSDVYAAGIVLFELLTGRTPFNSPTPSATFKRHLVEDPIPVTLARQNLSVPDGLQDLMSIALGKKAEERFQAANALRVALSSLLPVSNEEEEGFLPDTVLPRAAPNLTPRSSQSKSKPEAKDTSASEEKSETREEAATKDEASSKTEDQREDGGQKKRGKKKGRKRRKSKRKSRESQEEADASSAETSKDKAQHASDAPDEEAGDTLVDSTPPVDHEDSDSDEDSEVPLSAAQIALKQDEDAKRQAEATARPGKQTESADVETVDGSGDDEIEHADEDRDVAAGEPVESEPAESKPAETEPEKENKESQASDTGDAPDSDVIDLTEDDGGGEDDWFGNSDSLSPLAFDAFDAEAREHERQSTRRMLMYVAAGVAAVALGFVLWANLGSAPEEEEEEVTSTDTPDDEKIKRETAALRGALDAGLFTGPDSARYHLMELRDLLGDEEYGPLREEFLARAKEEAAESEGAGPPVPDKMMANSDLVAVQSTAAGFEPAIGSMGSPPLYAARGAGAGLTHATISWEVVDDGRRHWRRVASIWGQVADYTKGEEKDAASKSSLAARDKEEAFQLRLDTMDPGIDGSRADDGAAASPDSDGTSKPQPPDDDSATDTATEGAPGTQPGAAGDLTQPGVAPNPADGTGDAAQPGAVETPETAAANTPEQKPVGETKPVEKKPIEKKPVKEPPVEKKPAADPGKLTDQGFDELGAGKLDAARASFEKALSAKSSYPRALFGLGEVYWDKKDYAKAASYYEKATRKSPRNGGYFVKLGNSYIKLKRYKDALAAYTNGEKVARNSKTREAAQKGIAIAKRKLGQ